MTILTIFAISLLAAFVAAGLVWYAWSAAETMFTSFPSLFSKKAPESADEETP